MLLINWMKLIYEVKDFCRLVIFGQGLVQQNVATRMCGYFIINSRETFKLLKVIASNNNSNNTHTVSELFSVT